MKIKIKYHEGARKIEQHGNRIDLFPRKKYKFKAPIAKVTTGVINFDIQLIDLGISMDLPKHFEAPIIPRSSTFLKQGLLQANSYGLIDGGTNPSKGIKSSNEVYESYNGEQDIWMFPAIAFKETTITPEKALCQFRIQPSMNAPWWIKLRWLFTSKIEFVEVDVLHGTNRGGFGHTNKI